MTPPAAAVDERWNPLLRVAAAAALISAILIPIQIAVFIIWPPPLDGTVSDWFALLQSNRLAGLIDLDLLLVADNLLLIPILLAFYLALRRAHESTMLIAVALGLISVIMYLVSNPAIQLAAMSDRYSSATTEIERNALSAAGESMLALWQGTGFHVGYLCGSAAGILIGFVMLQSGVFSRLTGWLAVGANALGLGLYVPGVGVYISVFSVLFLEVWYVLIALRLRRLALGS